MKTTWTPLLILMLATISFGQSTQPAKPTMSVKKAIATLREAHIFSDHASPDFRPVQVDALYAILQHPNAAEILKKIERSSTEEGRLFAMCGLYYADRATFDAIKDWYEKCDRTVHTAQGCIVSDTPVVEIFPHIANGGYPHLFRTVGAAPPSTAPAFTYP